MAHLGEGRCGVYAGVSEARRGSEHLGSNQTENSLLQELKVQVLVTDISGHGHGARRAQSSENDGRLTSGMLLGKSTARGRRRRALDEEEEVEDVGVRTDGRR